MGLFPRLDLNSQTQVIIFSLPSSWNHKQTAPCQAWYYPPLPFLSSLLPLYSIWGWICSILGGAQGQPLNYTPSPSLLFSSRGEGTKDLPGHVKDKTPDLMLTFCVGAGVSITSHEPIIFHDELVIGTPPPHYTLASSRTHLKFYCCSGSHGLCLLLDLPHLVHCYPGGSFGQQNYKTKRQPCKRSHRVS